MDIIIYVGRVGRCMERECDGEIRSRGVRVQVSRRILNKLKKGVWERRRGVGKGSRAEKIRARRKDNGRVCTGVQESSKRKWVQEEAIGRGIQERNERSNKKETDGSWELTRFNRIIVQKSNSPRLELEGEQAWERKVKGEEETNGKSSQAGAMTDIAMTLSVTEEANTFSAGNNKTCSNRRSRKNECSNGERIRTRDGGSSKKRPLCNRSGQREELLCLQKIRAHGLLL